MKSSMKKAVIIIISVICIMTSVTISYFNFISLKTSGKYDLSILQEKVDVYFDHSGIPHIEGNKSEDVYRVFGFIMAGERLFQMDLLRRLINGQLSEIFGKEALDIDILMRKLRIKKNHKKTIYYFFKLILNISIAL